VSDDIETTSKTTEDTTSTEGAEDKVDKGAEGAEGKEDQTPKPRTYTEEEWNTRQSALDKRTAELDKRYKEQLAEERKKRAEVEDRAEEARWERMLKKVEDDEGPVDVTKMLIEEQRAFRQRQRAAEEEWRGKLEKITETEETSRVIAATKLAAKHELPDGFVKELLTAESPMDMENMALRKVLELTKAGHVPSKKVDQPTGSKASIDTKDMTPDDKIKWGLKQKRK